MTKKTWTSLIMVFAIIRFDSMAIAQQENINPIYYRVIKEWTTPEHRIEKIIVIDPQNGNETFMRFLGARLVDDTHRAHNLDIYIFDNERAARMPSYGQNTKALDYDGGFVTKHKMGQYVSGDNDNDCSLMISLGDTVDEDLVY